MAGKINSGCKNAMRFKLDCVDSEVTGSFENKLNKQIVRKILTNSSWILGVIRHSAGVRQSSCCSVFTRRANVQVRC